MLQVADAILGNKMFTRYDRLKLVQEGGFLQQALQVVIVASQPY
jgi:hypothetical protein